MNLRNLVVYISGSFWAKTEEEMLDNYRLARQTAKEYWARGYTVICPHFNLLLLPGYLPRDSDEGAMELLKRSDMVAVTCIGQRLKQSKGTLAELMVALGRGMDIFFEGNKLNEKTLKALGITGE